VIPLAGRRSTPPKATLGFWQCGKHYLGHFRHFHALSESFHFLPILFPNCFEQSLQYLTYLLSQEKKE
jgi:hypothetical protein